MLRFAPALALFALASGCGRSGLGLPDEVGGGGGQAPGPVCGDGVVDEGEPCDDGNGDDNDACSNQCTLKSCGNFVLDPAEDCEGSDLGGATCESIGFGPGTLACQDNCLFDSSGCNKCGNDSIDGVEQCDGSDLAGQTCESFGFASGTLSCTASCLYNFIACSGCGNTLIEAGEQCDSNNLGGQTCQTLGFTQGTLLCSNACTFDPSGCSSCGNGTIEAGEQCDDGNVVPGDGCSPTCQLPACGDGVLDLNEQCDNGPLNENRWALAYGLGQPATPDVALRPFDNAASAVSFFNYFSASSHTGFEQVNTSRIYFYRNTGNGILSLIFHHGIDETTSGISQPPSAVQFLFSGIPMGAFIAATDDDFSELFPLGGGDVQGDWTFQNNSDGGVIAGWPFPGDWESFVEPSFDQGIDTFELMGGDASFTNLNGRARVTFFAQSTPSACRTDCTVPVCGDGLFDAGEVCDDGNQVSGDGCSADCSALQ